MNKNVKVKNKNINTTHFLELTFHDLVEEEGGNRKDGEFLKVTNSEDSSKIVFFKNFLLVN